MHQTIVPVRIKRSGDRVITPSIFPPHVRAVFTTRSGGVSDAPYASMNLGLSTADSKERVAQNRQLAAGLLGLTSDHLAIAGQVHGADVLVVDKPGLYPGYDGLVTTQKNLILSISAADCASVLIADTASNVIGACHAGWRGHVEGVVDHTIAEMIKLGAAAASLVAYISPCISVANFEVGEEVVAHFSDEFVVRKAEWPRPHIDLSRSIEAGLIRRGIGPENIERSHNCTFGEPERFFSHRAQKGITGRMMGLICLTNI